MILLTKELEKKLPKLYATEKIPAKEKVAVVKFFTPDSNWTWFAVEYDPEEKLFFGLVKGFETEWGYFSLNELKTAKGPLGLHIERDLHFKPKKIKDIKSYE